MLQLAHDRLPSFNLSPVFSRRDRLFSILQSYANQTLSLAELHAIAASCQAILPGVAKSTIVESLSTLAGTQLTRATSFMTAWRLAGNLPLLRDRQAVHPWQAQYHDEWVPATPASATFERRHGKPGYAYSICVLAGTPVGMYVQEFWASKFTYVLANHIGFSPFGKVARFRHPLELVGMRFLLHFTRDSCKRGLQFSEVGCSPNFGKFNRDLNKARARVGFDCPYGFTHECYTCHVGYAECMNAVQPITIEPPIMEAADDRECTGERDEPV